MVTIKHSYAFSKNQFEKEAWEKNHLIAGIDEAGRGCLAGPVVAAAVILPPFKAPLFLKDSKIMALKDRLIAYDWIIKECWYTVGIADHTTIDKYNIWQATLIAMKKAALHIKAACPTPLNSFLIDAMPLSFNDPLFDATVSCHHFIHGEEKSSSIAAASIIAKVTRDRLMKSYDYIFPLYALAQHKGYGTMTHRERIKEHGISLIHRTTFSPCIQSESVIIHDHNNTPAKTSNPLR